MSPLRRLWNVVRRSRLDDDLRQELDTHVALIEEEERSQGLSADQARRNARTRFGNPHAYRERALDGVIATWFEHASKDVRFAARVLGRAPGFSAVAVLTMALGIGANAAIFSILNAVILRPLPYPNSERLMYVSAQYPALGTGAVTLSPPEYKELREVNRSFTAIGAFAPGAGEVNLTAPDRARRVRNANVDEHLFDALGLQPAQGRLFAPGETGRSDPAAPTAPVAILSHELWQTAFGGQPMIGKTVEVNSRPREVIGIMRPGADVLNNRTEIWLPLGLGPSELRSRRAHYLHVIGRLKDQVTAEAAQTELKTLNEDWGERVGVSDHMFAPMPTDGAARASNPDAGHVLQMSSLHDQIVSPASRAIWMLQVAAGLVLLIVCANLANLLAARAAMRRRELAVRMALGATGVRLLTQSIAEGALLSIIGGAVAVWIARVGLHALTQAYPMALPRSGEVSVDLPVLLFASGVAIATSVFFGLAQLRHIGIKGVAAALTDAGTKGATGGTRHYIRRSLVVVEVALAVILVAAAGLLIRTIANLGNVDAGFNRSRLVTFSITLPGATYPDMTSQVQTFLRLLDALRAVPGVEAATAMSGLPPHRPVLKMNTRIENATTPSVGSFHIVDYYQSVMPGYFETMGISIVRGRGFQATDTASSGLVVVVNERFADRFWKGLDPIGQRVKPGNDQAPWFTVVGVAKDVKQGGLDQETGTELYKSVLQPQSASPSHVVLRTTLAPAALSQTIERVVREMDPAVPVVRLRDMEAVFAESIQRPRFLAQLLGLFAGLALLVAALGTYGVISSLVAERRRELGIRLALGANRSGVLAHVMREGLLLTAIGLVVGLAGAVGLSRLIASLLFGVTPTDVPTVAGVTATMLIVAAVASLLPAWRASRLDPNAVLRV
jgi:predicted permease